jgi:hypothetical protein
MVTFGPKIETLDTKIENLDLKIKVSPRYRSTNSTGLKNYKLRWFSPCSFVVLQPSRDQERIPRVRVRARKVDEHHLAKVRDSFTQVAGRLYVVVDGCLGLKERRASLFQIRSTSEVNIHILKGDINGNLVI